MACRRRGETHGVVSRLAARRRLQLPFQPLPQHRCRCVTPARVSARLLLLQVRLPAQIALLQVHFREPSGAPRAGRPVQLQRLLPADRPPARHVRPGERVVEEDARRPRPRRDRTLGRPGRARGRAAGTRDRGGHRDQGGPDADCAAQEGLDPPASGGRARRVL
eukprot:3079154-Prymnesium_polylepis.2